MISFWNLVCVYVYKICEGKFGGSNKSFLWLSEKVNDCLMAAPGFLSVNKFSGYIFFVKISFAPNLP